MTANAADRRSREADMKLDRKRDWLPHMWVLLAPLLVVLAYLIGLALFDVFGAGYLRSFARRLFGV